MACFLKDFTLCIYQRSSLAMSNWMFPHPNIGFIHMLSAYIFYQSINLLRQKNSSVADLAVIDATNRLF